MTEEVTTSRVNPTYLTVGGIAAVLVLIGLIAGPAMSYARQQANTSNTANQALSEAAKNTTSISDIKKYLQVREEKENEWRLKQLEAQMDMISKLKEISTLQERDSYDLKELKQDLKPYSLPRGQME